VGYPHSFRASAAPGGVNHVSQTVRMERPHALRRVEGLTRQRREGVCHIRRVEHNRRHRIGEATGQPLSGDNGSQMRILAQRSQTRRRVAWVERQPCRTGLEHTEESNDERRGRFEADADDVVRADSAPGQQTGQPASGRSARIRYSSSPTRAPATTIPAAMPPSGPPVRTRACPVRSSPSRRPGA
jgi:hypothetical protein